MAEPEQIIGRVASLQPTIQRGGQRTIQVERARENKWQRLAIHLSQMNPTVTSYLQVSDIEAEQFEEEMAGKSLEEQQAILKKTEDEIDTLTRRGVMGWLTSPLNQKRKLQSIGKLASRDLVSEIEARLINPQQGDPEDLTERANLVRQQFIDKTPALQSSVFAQEGLNKVSNTRIQETVANYERQQAQQAKEETLLATASSFYDKLETFVDVENDEAERLRRGDFDFVVETIRDADNNVIGSVTLGDYLLNEWNETGAYTAKEQRSLLTGLLKKMATNGMEDQADGLLLWAKDKLKFGNAKMSSMQYEDLEFIIDKAAEAEEDRRDRDGLDFVKETTGEYKVKLTELKYSEDNQITYDGQTFSDKLALQEYFKQKVISNPDLNNEQKGNLLDEISTATQGSFRDSETYTKNLILRDAPEASADGINRQLNSILENIDIVEAHKNDPSVRGVIYNAQDRIVPLVSKYLNEELIGLPQELAVEKARIYVRSLLEEEMPKIQAQIREADDLLTEKEKLKDQGIELGEERPEEPQLPKPDDDPEKVINLLKTWQAFITDDPKDEKSNKAKKYIDKYTPMLANKTAEIALNRTFAWFGPDEAAQLHFQYAARMDGVFTLDVLERLDEKGFARTYAGIPFKPKKLIGNVNAGKYVLLSQEQLDNTDTPEGRELATKIKNAAGIDLDVYEFIRLQRKRRKQFIVPYEPLPDMYKPLDVDKELMDFINRADTPINKTSIRDIILIAD
jgi:hypothetical protein